jgi:hypothetical protein
MFVSKNNCKFYFEFMRLTKFYCEQNLSYEIHKTMNWKQKRPFLLSCISIICLWSLKQEHRGRMKGLTLIGMRGVKTNGKTPLKWDSKL